MQPIAQTFVVNEPNKNIDTILLSSIDIYFRDKSSVAGVEVQIRTTENGFPTQSKLPYASKVLDPSQINTSTDASVATNFMFDRPVVLRTNEQFAIVVIPVGGDPNYTIWIGAFGENDVLSGKQIDVNNPLGNLFTSTNDLVFTPIANESLKYTLYRADMTSLSGQAVYTNMSYDFFYYKELNGSFFTGETVVMSNNELKLASLTVSGANTFPNGALVYQSNGSANLAVGTVYYSNSTLILVSNVSGTFNTSNTLLSTVANTKPAPTPVYQNTTTTSACNVITVPNANSSLTTDFTVNNYIYVTKSDRTATQVFRVTGVDATNRQLTLSSNVTFTETNAIYGRVKGDRALYGILSSASYKPYQTGSMMILSDVTSNTSLNFANSEGLRLIGLSSGATARIIKVVDLPYESITPHFTSIVPGQTSMDWFFKGTSSAKNTDSSYQTVQPELVNEFIDENRIVMSRSNELQNPPSAGSGSKSIFVQANLNSGDTKTTPYIDGIRNTITVTHNIIKPEFNLSGYKIFVNGFNGDIGVGNTVWQNNATSNTYGTVTGVYNGVIRVANVQSDNTSVLPFFVANGTANLTSTSGPSYVIGNVFPVNEAVNPDFGFSRYISKNVVLNPGQDAEDLVGYLTAYRPANTNCKVYAKVLSSADKTPLVNRPWGLMTETATSAANKSSSVVKDDYIELSYTLPLSVSVFATGANCTNNTNYINMPSGKTNDGFSVGDFIYITDTSSKAFNIRQITKKVTGNTTAVFLNANVSITTSSGAVGKVPNLETQYAPFKYDQNNNIVRYTNADDSVYDSFLTFAIKIVLTADDPRIVPRVMDMRCIALQV